MIDLEYEHGRLIAVDEVSLGSALVAAAAAGATVITVDDAADFDEDGGTIQVGGVQYAYESCDDDTGDIVLVDPLEADADEGDTVDVYDTLRQVVSTEKVCLVELDGEDENVDPLEATLAHYLAEDVGEGIRPTGQGESVRIALDGDELLIVDVLGLADRSASGMQFKREYLFTLTAAGAQDLELNHNPIDDSVQLRINGIDYHPSDGWSRAGSTVTLLADIDPRAGDRVSVQYAYLAGFAAPTPEALVQFGSTGWRYLQVASTDAGDYSAPGFDDSAWAVGQAPFGYQGSTADPLPTNVLPIVTNWDGDTRLWARLTFPAAVGVSGTVRIEDNAHIYVNGNLVVATPVIGAGGNIDPGVTFDVPDDYLTTDGSDNVLAIRFDDEYEGVTSYETTYGDIELTGQRA